MDLGVQTRARQNSNMMITKRQWRRLLREYRRNGNMEKSAMRADVDRKTARKYIRSGKKPAEQQVKHDWPTRADPLEAIWPEAAKMLEAAPELEAKALLEYLVERSPAAAQESQLRTFQRRVQQWRLTHGPEREVYFPQDSVPGKYLEIDWTHARELGVTVGGQPLDHLLFHAALKYSNWEWATRCQSESLLSLRHGLQAALWHLGKVPEVVRVDNSSAATHRIKAHREREFNPDFVGLAEHYGLQPQTINLECPNENGDVESANGHLKRRLRQHLLLRGSREFATEAAYDRFREDVLARANRGRALKLAEELAVMRPLPPTRLSEYDELQCPVSQNSTIRVKKVTYSVPARWVGQELKVEIYERELHLYHGRERLLTVPRACGNRGSVIDWRHMIKALLRKPGAFERYRYRQEFYPSGRFRAAHDRLANDHGQRQGDLEYLRLLELALELGVSQVEGLLHYYMQAHRGRWWVAQLRGDVTRANQVLGLTPELQPDLGGYDALLGTDKEVGYGA